MRCPQCDKLMRLVHGHEMESCDVAHEVGGRECKERQLAQAREREAEHNEEVDEFNSGYAAATRGEPVEAEPPDAKHDQWAVGWYWFMGDKLKARADKLQEKLDRLYDDGLDGPQLIDDLQAFGDRIDEFRGDQTNPLTLTEQRELAEWWAERGALVADLGDGCYTEMARADKAEVQLTGCLTAAEGWVDIESGLPQEGDWAWSPAFAAVLKIRNRADSAEAILRAANFCEAHLPDPGEPEKVCMACEAVHENDLRVKTEARAEALLACKNQLLGDMAILEGTAKKCNADWIRVCQERVVETTRANKAEAKVKRLEAHDVEMAKWLESKSYALALALGVPGDEQTPPTDELIERVKRLREAFNTAVRKPMGVVPAGFEDLYDAKEADDGEAKA